MLAAGRRSGSSFDFPRFDLSLESRRDDARTTSSTRRRRDPRARARPEGGDGHARGSPATSARPNRILREEIGGKVIVRTGRRIPGVVAARRRARADLGRAHGRRRRVRREGMARGRRRRRGRVPHRADRAADLPRRRGVRVPRRPSGPARRSSAGRSTRSARSTRGCSRRRWTPPPARHPEVAYEPQLIDATFALLLSSSGDAARDPGAEPRRRHPLRPRAAALRLDRRLGVAARRVRRRLRARRRRWPRPRTAPPRRSRARTSRTRWR